MLQIFWNFKTELCVSFDDIGHTFLPLINISVHRAPTWSYDQAVAQGWIPVDLNDRVYVQESIEPFDDAG